MFTGWKLLLSAVVVIGLTVLAVAGWLVFAPPPDPFSAEEMLHRSRVNTSAVATYKFTTDARFTVQAEGAPQHQEIHSEVVVVAGEGMHVKATGNGTYSETLLLDGKQYHRDSDAGPWDESPIPNYEWDAANVPNPGTHLQLLDGLTRVSHEGTEIMGDVRVDKVAGDMDMAQHVKEAWGEAGRGDLRAQMLAGTVTVTAWLGAEDGLLHAYSMEGSFPAVGESFAYQYSMDVHFSHFNEPLELPSPNAGR